MSAVKTESGVQRFTACSFEFTDPRIMELQDVERLRNPILMKSVMFADPFKRSNPVVMMHHRHETNDSLTGIVGLGWSERDTPLAENLQIEKATIILVDWIDEVGYDNLTFTRAKVTSFILGGTVQASYLEEDCTETAKHIEFAYRK